MRYLFILLLCCSAQAATIPAITNVFTGTTNNDPTADSVRTAFSKINTNLLRISDLWDDVRIPLASTRGGATAATAATFKDSTRAYSFANTPEQSLEFEMQIPHGVDTNTPIDIHVHWTADAAATGVVWGVEYTVANPSAVWGATTTTRTTNTCTGAFVHTLSEIVHITNFVESTVIVGRLFRDNTDAYGGAVFGISLDGHYKRHSLGSFNETGDY